MTRGCACPERLCRELISGQQESGCRVVAELQAYATPVIHGDGPIRPAAPALVLPLCMDCGIRGCIIDHARRQQRRWWQRIMRRWTQDAT